MGENTLKPDENGRGNAAPVQPEPETLPGEKDGKLAFRAEGSDSAGTPSHESKVGIGNRKATAEDKEKAGKPKATTEIAVKPLYSKTFFDNTLEKGHGNKENDDDQSYY